VDITAEIRKMALFFGWNEMVAVEISMKYPERAKSPENYNQ